MRATAKLIAFYVVINTGSTKNLSDDISFKEKLHNEKIHALFGVRTF